MKSNLIRIMISLVVIAIVLCSVNAYVYAATPSDFITSGDKINTTSINDIGNWIASVITAVGMFASIIVLILIGIRYMMGSAEEKSEYKKTLLPYFIGAIMVFAATAIVSIIKNMMANA